MSTDRSEMSSGGTYPSTVVDERGETFELEDEPLGKGGQGVVVRTRGNSDVVVKFCSTSNGAPSRQKPQLRRHLEELRLLPLDGLDLARPLELLRGTDVVGYTMRLMRDMQPVSELIAADGVKSLVGFYLEGGGLRRRLRLLEKAASTLAELHATPLVYGDVSAENVFVSESKDAEEVWFIDSDNLGYCGEELEGIYTPMFGAPELVTGRAPTSTTFTDVYSFAILAFWVLVQSHPFLGEAVESGGWDESSTDREMEAKEGKLPFVDDPDDTSNRGLHGFSQKPDLVLTKKLRELFRQMFTEGRTDPLARPKAAHFVEAFRDAANRTVRCPECSSTYYVTAGSCHWCQGERTRPDVIYIEARRWDPRLDETDWEQLFATDIVFSRVLEIEGKETLGKHAVAAVPLRYESGTELEFRFRQGGVEIQRRSDREFWLVTDVESKPVRLASKKTVPIPRKNRRWHLHCGPLDEPHRLLSFQFFPGEQR